ncbi:MAG: metG [Conexibacter sp.]|nr:metG [Conexibacter sp.]
MLLHAWIPDRAGILLAALGAGDLDGDTAPALAIAGARFGAGVPTQVSDIDPLFPKQQQPQTA